MGLKLSANSMKVLERRYLKKDNAGKVIESAEDMFHRVARAIAQADKQSGKAEKDIAKIEESFYRMMTSLEFLPNSPCLMNAGRELGQLSACFTLPINDSMDSIFETLKATAMIHKSGGGTGFSFSRIRAKNSVVKTTGGIASGPVSFMKVYDAATEAVKQGGTRRGANMGILRVDHPDILEFIACKTDNKLITNFNISVAITDDFMRKLKDNKEYELVDPRTKEIVTRLNAKDVFETIVKQAYKNGEPGIIFIDKVNADNPTPHLGDIESTNPCVTGDTFISTEKGLMKMKDLVARYGTGGIAVLTDGRVADILYGGGSEGGVATQVKAEVTLNRITAAFKTGVKPVLKLVTASGYELTATFDHQLMTPEGWVKMQDLEPGKHRVLIQPAAGKFNDDAALPFEVKNEYTGENGKTTRLNLPSQWTKELGQVLGWLVGDGWLIEGNNCRAGFTFSRDDAQILDYVKPVINGYYGSDIKEILRENDVHHLSYHSKYFVQFFRELGVKPSSEHNKEVPDALYTATEEAVTGFLQGLFTADGTVGYTEDKNAYIRLTARSLNLLKGVQILLLNLGIKSKIYDRSRTEREGFEYISKSGEKRTYKLDGVCFELAVARNAVPLFLEKIGFLCGKHAAKIEKLLSKEYYNAPFIEEIESIEPCGEAEVFDLTEPQTLTFIGNGFVSLDCGEQPLLPYESCDLGSINLARMYKQAPSGFEVDWEKLREVTRLAVHFLDNLIDVNRFPLPEIENATKVTRKIGLGVMGWASMLIGMQIPYNSEEAIQLADKVMAFILEESTKKSRELAVEKGVFPSYKGSKLEKQGQRLRNATLTTIAPTGTISIIAGPCSSGIEPIFAVSYYRNVMDNDKLVEVDPQFEEVARRRGFYSRQLMEKIAESSSLQKIEGIPEDVKKIFVTAHDINPEWHVRMQAVFQKYTHNAVSKTINFPHEATVEDVRKSYILAYDSGCKGITIYRDGSREEQVLNIAGNKPKEDRKAQQEPAKEIAPRPRPEVIPGTTTKVSTGCGNLYVTINIDDESKPFELFTQMGKAGGCAASQLEAIGRLVSMAFRSGIEVKAIIEQLRNIRCPSPSWEKGQRIFSCADAIARVIEKRLVHNQAQAAHHPAPAESVEVPMKHSRAEDASPAYSGARGDIVGVCPDCGGALRHEEGCMKCHACGFSRC